MWLKISNRKPNALNDAYLESTTAMREKQILEKYHEREWFEKRENYSYHYYSRIWKLFRSNVHYLSSSKNKAWKNSGLCGEPMTPTKLVQRFTNRANKPTGSWSLWWFQINPVVSVGRALRRCRRGHGFESCTGLNFLGLIFTTAQVVFITAKIAFIFASLSAVQIYDFHIFIVVYYHYNYYFNVLVDFIITITTKNMYIWLTRGTENRGKLLKTRFFPLGNLRSQN